MANADAPRLTLGIAQVAATAGIKVKLFDMRAGAAESGKAEFARRTGGRAS